MAARSSKRLTGFVAMVWLVAVAHGCGGDFTGAGTEPDSGGLGDAGVSDSTTRGDTEPSDGSGGSDGSVLDSGSIEAGAADAGADSGPSPDASDGAACPQPHPMSCGTVLECPCVDGTRQIAGCPNGFTCPQACCGHGGSM
jgi:hypothetical protein